MNSLTIGSRGSRLALWQAEHVRRSILDHFPKLDIQIRIIRTTGDQLQEAALSSMAGKGVFVKEIEQALLAGQIDLAVHSLKDVPTELPEGLVLSTYLAREDPRDAFVSTEASDWSALASGAVVGTSSLRRGVQLSALRSDLTIRPIRGNVDTRLRKLDRGEFDALILARAGLVRLGFSDRIASTFEIHEMTPAVGQGALAIETRVDEQPVLDVLAPLDDPKTRICVEAEREFLAGMGGGCQVPLGAHVWIESERAQLSAFVAGPESGRVLRREGETSINAVRSLVLSAVEVLRNEGAEELLAEVTT